MGRAFGNIITVTYLILFLAFAFMWLRGCVVSDNLRHHNSTGFRGAVSSRGDLAIYSYEWPQPIPDIETGWNIQTGSTMDISAVELEKAVGHRTFIGFYFFRDSKISQPPATGRTLRGWCFVVPYWFLTLLVGLLPLGRLLRMTLRDPRRPPARPASAVPAAPPANEPRK